MTDVRTMEPAAAADVLRRAVDPTKPMTVADASVKSGLALRDAEAGLTWLTSEYRGHLRVTEDGDLVHLFPTGFTKPWESRERFAEIVHAIGRGALGVGRFVVRAWLLIAMVMYALAFLAITIGLSMARQGSSDRDSPAFGIAGALFRMIADALFWTFHPFSPIYYAGDAGYVGQPEQEAEGEKVPFYEKVNRFVFGPPEPKVDPHAARAKILAEIRAQKGRIGLGDVMRVTGLPRDEADPLMARLMLDHDGTVDVAEGGGIVYRFEALRRSADEAPVVRPAPAWAEKKEAPPLTGNGVLANIGIALLNAFNLGMGALAISESWTIGNLVELFSRHPRGVEPILTPGTPILLGVVPVIFSLAIFVLPLARSVLRLRAAAKAREERARLAVLEEVMAHAPKKEPVTDEALRSRIRIATGAEPTSKEVTARVVALGGDVDVGPEGEVRYRFADLEAEAEALEDERAHASPREARLAPIAFATDD